MTDDLGTPIAIAPVGEAQLVAVIRNTESKPLLANLFPVLHHHDSGYTWRRISYQASLGGYVWRRLPAGAYTLRVSAAAMRPVAHPLSLRPEARITVEIMLSPARDEAPLDLRVDDRAPAFHRIAARLTVDAAHRHRFASAPEAVLASELGADPDSSSQPRLRRGSQLLAAFLADDRLRSALTLPVTQLPQSASLRRGLEDVLRAAWEFHIRPDLVERIVPGLINNRLRLIAVTQAAFHVPLVRALVPELSPADVGREVLRCVEALDYPELDDILPLLGDLVEPRTAAVQRLFRAMQGPFDVRVPAGIARSRRAEEMPHHAALAIAPPAMALDDDPGARPNASESIFTMHLLAETMTWALDPPGAAS